MELCTKCKHRRVCTSLCSQAEIYVDQDRVGGDFGFRGDVFRWASLDDVPATVSIWEQSTVLCIEAAEVVGLSNSELEILTRRYAGFTYAEIAKQLGVSTKGVENALGRAYRKLKKGFLASSKRVRLRKRESSDENKRV